MVKRNPNFTNLSENYLFPEVTRRAASYQDLISLSIGDTSEPIPSPITEAMEEAAKQLSSPVGYRGYGAEQGDMTLREKIAEVIYKNTISPEEIFISDGAKCDIGRLQVLFGAHVTIAVQNPTYPVYVDTARILNQTVIYLDCTPLNGFFPELKPADIYFICSPNNPTGVAATQEQLQLLVNHAIENQALIVFDAAYASFIQDPSLPRCIYEIQGAEKVAIEVSSFSKLIGFTGVRLGWSVVPKGTSLHKDYKRLISTFFNGASNISQAGGRAALEHPEHIKKLCTYYLENTRLIKEALEEKKFLIYGGENAPYLWVDFGKRDSWELFQLLLEKTGLITTPGSGFGSCGEGFLRFSAFGNRDQILTAVERINTQWPEQLSLLPT